MQRNRLSLPLLQHHRTLWRVRRCNRSLWRLLRRQALHLDPIRVRFVQRDGPISGSSATTNEYAPHTPPHPPIEGCCDRGTICPSDGLGSPSCSIQPANPPTLNLTLDTATNLTFAQCFCIPGSGLLEVGSSFMCAPCPSSTFNNQDDPFCLPCGSGKTSDEGSISSDQCTCPKGTWWFESHCRSCPRGARCSGGSLAPSAKKGYYQSSSDPSVFLKCTPEDACVGDGACSIGHSGYLCAECDLGWFHLVPDSRCTPCGPASLVRFLVFLVLLLFIACGSLVLGSYKPRTSRGLGSGTVVAVRFVIELIQVVVVLGRYSPIPFPISLSSFWLGVIAFDTRWAVVECFAVLAGSAWEIQWITSLLVAPVTLLLLVAVWLIVRKYIKNRFENEEEDLEDVEEAVLPAGAPKPPLALSKSFIAHIDAQAQLFNAFTRGVTVILFITFLPLCATVASYWGCDSSPDGTWTLRADHGVSCWQGRHLAMLPIAIIATIVLVPLAVVGLGGVFGARATFASYRPGWYGWEWVGILWKLAVAIGLLIPGSGQALVPVIAIGTALVLQMKASPRRLMPLPLPDPLVNLLEGLMLACAVLSALIIHGFALSNQGLLAIVLASIAVLGLLALFICAAIVISLPWVRWRFIYSPWVDEETVEMTAVVPAPLSQGIVSSALVLSSPSLPTMVQSIEKEEEKPEEKPEDKEEEIPHADDLPDEPETIPVDKIQDILPIVVEAIPEPNVNTIEIGDIKFTYRSMPPVLDVEFRSLLASGGSHRLINAARLRPGPIRRAAFTETLSDHAQLKPAHPGRLYTALSRERKTVVPTLRGVAIAAAVMGPDLGDFEQRVMLVHSALNKHGDGRVLAVDAVRALEELMQTVLDGGDWRVGSMVLGAFLWPGRQQDDFITQDVFISSLTNDKTVQSLFAVAAPASKCPSPEPSTPASEPLIPASPSEMFSARLDQGSVPHFITVNPELEMCIVAEVAPSRVAAFVFGSTSFADTALAARALSPVWRLDAGAEQVTRPSGIALDTTRNLLYLADWNADRVLVFQVSRSSKPLFLHAFGERGSGDGQFRGPQGIALTETGSIWITDMDNARLQCFSSSGRHEKTLKPPIEDELSFPCAVAVGPLGVLAVSDSHNHRVFIVSGNVAPRWQRLAVIEGLEYPHGLCFDGKSLIIADRGNKRVVRASLTGSLSVLIDGLDSPRDVALLGNKLMVTDSGARRLTAFSHEPLPPDESAFRTLIEQNASSGISLIAMLCVVVPSPEAPPYSSNPAESSLGMPEWVSRVGQCRVAANSAACQWGGKIVAQEGGRLWMAFSPAPHHKVLFSVRAVRAAVYLSSESVCVGVALGPLVDTDSGVLGYVIDRSSTLASSQIGSVVVDEAVHLSAHVNLATAAQWSDAQCCDGAQVVSMAPQHVDATGITDNLTPLLETAIARPASVDISAAADSGFLRRYAKEGVVVAFGLASPENDSDDCRRSWGNWVARAREFLECPGQPAKPRHGVASLMLFHNLELAVHVAQEFVASSVEVSLVAAVAKGTILWEGPDLEMWGGPVDAACGLLTSRDASQSGVLVTDEVRDLLDVSWSFWPTASAPGPTLIFGSAVTAWWLKNVQPQKGQAEAVEAARELAKKEHKAMLAEKLERKREELREKERTLMKLAQAAPVINVEEIKVDVEVKAEAKVVTEAMSIAAAEAQAKAEAQAEAIAQAKAIAEAQAIAEAEAKAKAEAEAKAKAEADAQAIAEAEAEAQAIAEAEAKAKAEADAQAIAEAEAKAEAQAIAEAEAQAIAEAEAKAKAEAQAEAETEAMEIAEAEASLERMRAKADAALAIRKAEAEARAKAEAEAEFKAQAEAQAKEEAEANAKAEGLAVAKAMVEAEAEAEAMADEAKAKAESLLTPPREGGVRVRSPSFGVSVSVAVKSTGNLGTGTELGKASNASVSLPALGVTVPITPSPSTSPRPPPITVESAADPIVKIQSQQPAVCSPKTKAGIVALDMLLESIEDDIAGVSLMPTDAPALDDAMDAMTGTANFIDSLASEVGPSVAMVGLQVEEEDPDAKTRREALEDALAALDWAAAGI